MQPNSEATFQTRFKFLYRASWVKASTRASLRKTSSDGRITDQWLFKMSVPGRAKVVLYNGDRLRDLEFEIYRNDQRLTRSDALLITRESDSTTVVALPAPASGTLKIIRSGTAKMKQCMTTVLLISIAAHAYADKALLMTKVPLCD